MSGNNSQSLKNHARFDPIFHGILSFILLANLIISIVHMVLHLNFMSIWLVVLSIGAIFLLFRLRQYPLKVQDRVIRLEERLRLQALAPAAWQSEVYRLKEDQLIALRFADDGEVVDLAKQALEENLTRKQIKERIKNWREDNWRV